MEGFLSQVLTSLGSASLVGILFWAWINSRFKAIEEKITDNRELRKEDKESIEEQLKEVRDDLKAMPDRILSMIKQFINK